MRNLGLSGIFVGSCAATTKDTEDTKVKPSVFQCVPFVSFVPFVVAPQGRRKLRDRHETADAVVG
jgi:hypothetical protein